MAPLPCGTASCIACARNRTSGTASRNAMRPGRHQRGVLAEAVPGHHRGHRAARVPARRATPPRRR